MPPCDTIALTAASPEQATLYDSQLARARRLGHFPTSNAALSVPDPDVVRIGSGAANFRAVTSVVRHLISQVLQGPDKEGKDVIELTDQRSLLKDTISKKDDEIDRLQLLNTSTSRSKSTKQADSLLKHSSSSPGITSLGKASGVGSGAASDLDNFSDTSDRRSEARSMLFVDPEVFGLGDVDSDGRLSNASDGAGAETDSSVISVVDQEQEKTSSAAKERLTKVANRVQKLTVPKVSSSRTKPRDPPTPKSSDEVSIFCLILVLCETCRSSKIGRSPTSSARGSKNASPRAKTASTGRLTRKDKGLHRLFS